MSAHDEKPEQPEAETFDFGLKKKKKKKAAPTFDEIEGPVTDAAPEAATNDDSTAGGLDASALADAENMFADLKKKKKKKKATFDESTIGGEESGAAGTPEDAAAGEDNADDAAAPVDDFEFGAKKKKKTKRSNLADFEAQLKEGQSVEAEETADAAERERKEGEDAWLGSNRDYTYSEMLGRVFQILRHHNPELVGDKKRYTIAPPQVMREGTKKSVFANVVDICKRMHRQPDHVIQYLFAELGTTGSIDGAQRLIIKGRFQQKQIENVLKHYFMEYVTCKTCKSADTILTKENRLFFLQCESCGSTRTVSAIKTGFMAQTRDARKAARAQA
ncbi:eukaryotic translation initiation factor 2 beta [Phlyctochytrium arcticum]|nr:eukaryotic translation initiation factor 2 beta [Phlyctochytrium arcticum]